MSPLVLPTSRILLVQVGFTAYLVVGGLLATYLPTYLDFYFILFYFPSSSREKISQWESNRQPLHLEMGTSPLSLGSLGSVWTFSCWCCYKVDACLHILFSPHSLLIGFGNKQLLVWDDSRIQIMPVAICFIIVGAHMNMLLSTKVKILVLIKWSYRSLLDHVVYWV
jgi:hypothetical protein